MAGECVAESRESDFLVKPTCDVTHSGSEPNPGGKCGIRGKIASARKGSDMCSKRCGRVAGQHKAGRHGVWHPFSPIYYNHIHIATHYEHALENTRAIASRVGQSQGTWFFVHLLGPPRHLSSPLYVLTRSSPLDKDRELQVPRFTGPRNPPTHTCSSNSIPPRTGHGDRDRRAA